MAYLDVGSAKEVRTAEYFAVCPSSSRQIKKAGTVAMQCHAFILVMMRLSRCDYCSAGELAVVGQ